jgi:protein O-mannosyl-transferase
MAACLRIGETSGPRAAALAIAVVLAYLPSLGGGFLSWDDPWLVEHNPTLATHDARSLSRIWTDFGSQTRVALGAEYLPVRDTVVWIETALFGLSARALRMANLLWYAAAVLLLRAYLLRALGPRGEWAAWLFALHPAHVESVAWIAGHKDTLALLAIAGALVLHARGGRARWFIAPLLGVAHLCKAVTVVGIVLLLAHDWLARRRPDWRVYAPAAVFAAGAVWLHASVGAAVGMQSARASLAASGAIWPAYLRLAAWPGALSILHDVPSPALWGHGLVLALGAIAFALVRKSRLPLFAWIWFVAPLLPVSGLLFSLQNALADRYLLLSLLGPCALLAAAPVRPALTLALALALGACTGLRAELFRADVPLFEDAARKTETSAAAPFKLGTSYAAAGRLDEAAAAYREAVRREPRGESGRAATNDLAALLAKRGDLRGAEAVYRVARRTWPDDPKLLGNLAEVVARQGRRDEARALFLELIARFPRYQPGRRNYDLRFGRH